MSAVSCANGSWLPSRNREATPIAVTATIAAGGEQVDTPLELTPGIASIAAMRPSCGRGGPPSKLRR